MPRASKPHSGQGRSSTQVQSFVVGDDRHGGDGAATAVVVPPGFRPRSAGFLPYRHRRAAPGVRLDVPVAGDHGRIVVAQFPNRPLWLFLGLTLLHRVLAPDGATGTALRAAATAALVWWAVLEIGWGVNPFRRVLGATFLGLTAWWLVSGA